MNTVESILSEDSLNTLKQILGATEVGFFARSAHLSLNRNQQIEIPINEIIIQHRHQGLPTQTVKLKSSWFDSGSTGDVYKLELENQPGFTPDFNQHPDLRVYMRCQINPNRIYIFGREYPCTLQARDIDFLSKQEAFSDQTLKENQTLTIRYESIIWIEQDPYNFLIIKCSFNGLEISYNDFATQNYLLYLWEDERNERWYKKTQTLTKGTGN
ncbi:hypothetical protein [Rudanella lutea]|uniref:hypothetical protein n=1 Tax=Rudanella lutea TaxID=451374 RepID=UPI00036C8366|nr:hypothetical protein [Rudanella lutea]